MRAQNEDRIRTTIDRLLAGDIPAGGGCDVKTLARESGLDRTAFYAGRAYAHLRVEFETRLQQAARTGHTPDQRDAHINRLKHEIAALTERVAQRDRTIDELCEFKVAAVSRLAAQHDEITHLREALTDSGNVRRLPGRTNITSPSR